MDFKVATVEPTFDNSHAEFAATHGNLTLFFQRGTEDDIHRPASRRFDLVGLTHGNTRLVSRGSCNHSSTIDALTALSEKSARQREARERVAYLKRKLAEAESRLGELSADR